MATNPNLMGHLKNIATSLDAIEAASSGAGLTDAQLRATAVPVSGTVTATGPVTDAELRASAVPVSSTTLATAALQGALTETAPASDTASSGANGRLQRIAQRLTSLIAQIPATLGQKTMPNSLSVAPASLDYEAVAASVTDSIMGATGATGDYLSHIVIQPTTLAAGTVIVKDNTTVIFTFTSGTLTSLAPITVPFGALCTTAWKITTGANVAVLAFGKFT